MRPLAEFTKTTLIGGVLVIIPVYLSVLLLVKAFAALLGLVAPISQGLPLTLPFRQVIAVLVLIGACFISGIAVRTGPGLRAKNALERSLLEKIPGYALIRGLAGRIVGKTDEHAFTVVLAEIEDALVPAVLVRALRRRPMRGLRALGAHACRRRDLHHRQPVREPNAVVSHSSSQEGSAW